MYRFRNLPEYKLKALALQAIRLKEHCDSVLIHKNKSYNFIIDNFLSGKFWIPQKHSPLLAVVGSWHYWIPTIRQTKSIFREMDILLDYYRLPPEHKCATYHHTVTCADPWPKHPWDSTIWAQGFFMENAYMECLIIFCTRHPGKVEDAISRIAERAREFPKGA